jgi:hypothetical protein
MRRTIAVLGFASALAGAALAFTVFSPGASGASGKQTTFVVPAGDGYGVGDCLANGLECGKLVATAWCESQGFLQATSFGPAANEDVTGSIEAAPQRRPEPAIAITCVN